MAAQLLMLAHRAGPRHPKTTVGGESQVWTARFRQSAKEVGIMAAEGLVTRASRNGPVETVDRLTAAITARGAAVLARVDHAKAAASVGLTLKPTEVVIFGNPRAGTALMQAVQTMGIDLPLRALVWTRRVRRDPSLLQ